MRTGIKQAVEMYNQASLAEQEGRVSLAEVYYLKSWALFEHGGDRYYVKAANALNALACLRHSLGNHEGALVSAKRSVQMIESHPGVFAGAEAKVICLQAWELVKNLLLLQEPGQKFSPEF